MLNNPAVLLVLSGFLIGANFPLGKLASNAGISPILWPLLISAGAVVGMAALLAGSGKLQRPNRAVLRFSLLSGLISFFAANILVFALIPIVGSGYVGIMFAMSPVVTLGLAILFRLKAPSRIGVIGVFIGFIGACLVAYSRQGGVEAVALAWIAVAFLIPTTLAVGNIYRTIGWPAGASPDDLALWTNVFASIAYILVLLFYSGGLQLGQLADAPVAAFLQFAAGALTFPLYFRLQKFGGPVLLSQLGYIAAAVGMAAATLFLGERYPALTWVGALIILVGIGLSIRAQALEAVEEAAQR
ncbi:MAG: DMT family transporter [Devosiaceae bacterium]|nr:DMT family transporter [Devosiaceae bacterium MH13]